jgi:chromate reductase, NAD(P)H dehydrogenase (quinone)
MRILAISGSLRANSSNTSALQALAMLAPTGIEVVLYEGLGQLPLYNPDLDVAHLPLPVAALRQEIAVADGLVICSPEYAHGIAGALKNALDWLVSGVEFPGKPVAIINTSPRAEHAQAQLREILKTMSALVVEEASIAVPLLGRNLDAAGIAADPLLSADLQRSLQDFARAIKRYRIEAL